MVGSEDPSLSFLYSSGPVVPKVTADAPVVHGT